MPHSQQRAIKTSKYAEADFRRKNWRKRFVKTIKWQKSGKKEFSIKQKQPITRHYMNSSPPPIKNYWKQVLCTQ